MELLINYFFSFFFWSVGTLMIALMFKGTIAAFLNGLNNGDLSNKQRSKVLLLTVLFISCMAFVTKSSPEEEISQKNISSEDQQNEVRVYTNPGYIHGVHTKNGIKLI